VPCVILLSRSSSAGAPPHTVREPASHPFAPPRNRDLGLGGPCIFCRVLTPSRLFYLCEKGSPALSPENSPPEGFSVRGYLTGARINFRISPFNHRLRFWDPGGHFKSQLYTPPGQRKYPVCENPATNTASAPFQWPPQTEDTASDTDRGLETP